MQRRGAVTTVPGLYFIGLPFMYRGAPRSSGGSAGMPPTSSTTCQSTRAKPADEAEPPVTPSDRDSFPSVSRRRMIGICRFVLDR